MEYRERNLKNFFEEKNLKLVDQWISGCVEYFTEKFGPQLNEKRLSELAYEQFLHSDLNMIGLGSLPVNVAEMHKITLQGPFILQIDEFVDISEPLHTPEIPFEKQEKEKKEKHRNRMMKFNLTDGKQRLFGIEFQPLPSLSANTPRGFKIQVGNVVVRRGLLFLGPGNSQLLGGKVEELNREEENGVISPLPNNVHISPNHVNNNHAPSPPSQNVSQKPPPPHPKTSQPSQPFQKPPQFSQQLSAPHIYDDLPDLEDFVPSRPSSFPPATATGEPSSVMDLTGDSEDEEKKKLVKREMDALMEVEEEFFLDDPPETLPLSFPPVEDENYDPIDPSEFDEALETYPRDSVVLKDEIDSSASPPPKTKKSYKEKDSPLIQKDVPKIQFSYLSDIKKLSPFSTPKTYWIQAAVTDTVPPFLFVPKYSLKVKIEDGTGLMTVALSDAVLSRLIGLPSTQFDANLKSDEGKLKNKKHLSQMEQRITQLEGVMELSVSRELVLPLILSIRPPSSSDGWALVQSLTGLPLMKAEE